MSNKLFYVLAGIPKVDGDLYTFYCPPIVEDEPNFEQVYAFEMSDSTVKVGISREVPKRIKSVESAVYLSVRRVFQTEPGPPNLIHKIEKLCHARFAADRVRGEFFNITFEESCEELKRYSSKINAARNAQIEEHRLKKSVAVWVKRLRHIVSVETGKLLTRWDTDSEGMRIRARIYCAGVICFVIEHCSDDDLDVLYSKCKSAFDEINATHHNLTGTIKKFCERLKARGELDRPESEWHTDFAKLVNKIIGVVDDHDTSPRLKAFRLMERENICAKTIARGMNDNLSQHDIYEACKEKLDAWHKLINE